MPGVGRNVASHASPAARFLFCPYFALPGPFTFILPPSSFFFFKFSAYFLTALVWANAVSQKQYAYLSVTCGQHDHYTDIYLSKQTTDHRPQPTAQSSQPTGHRPQPTAHRPQPTAHSPQLTVPRNKISHPPTHSRKRFQQVPVVSAHGMSIAAKTLFIDR